MKSTKQVSALMKEKRLTVIQFRSTASTLPHFKDLEEPLFGRLWTCSFGGCASIADWLNDDAHFVWVSTGDNQISIGACEPQLVAVKDANLT